MEAKGKRLYSGFEDFSTKTDLYNSGRNRPLTEDNLLPSTVSDICVRASPLDDTVMKEISRIAALACRFTFTPATPSDTELRYLRSIGAVIEQASIASASYPTVVSQDWVVYVVIMRGDGRYIDRQGNWVSAR